MFIDTHLHLVDRGRLSYPWLEGAPALNRDWPYDAYAATARRIGISGALHMEVDCAEADIDRETAFVADLMARPDGLMLGAISSARPEAPDFEGWLEAVDRRVVRGVRRVLHTMPDDLSTQPQFRANIRKLGAAGLPFDICMAARQLDLAVALVDACDQTQFVLDHCGVPDIAGGGLEDWARAITALAERPHVSAKISGITAYARPDWTLDDLRPYVEQVIEAFGWDRVVWGSDSPVCTLQSSLPEWMAATQALISGASASERAAFAAGNARRIWGL